MDARNVDNGFEIPSKDYCDQPYVITTARSGALRFEMCDGWNGAFWESDPGSVAATGEYHATGIVVGGPQFTACVIVGQFCDGGTDRIPGMDGS